MNLYGLIYLYYSTLEEYGTLLSILNRFECEKKLTANSFLGIYIYSSLSAAVKFLAPNDLEKLAFICTFLKEVENSDTVKSFSEKVS